MIQHFIKDIIIIIRNFQRFILFFNISKVRLNIYWRIRIGLVKSINTYLRLLIHVVCGGIWALIKRVLIEFAITNGQYLSKSDPWQRYTPLGPPPVGMSIPPPATTESLDRELSSTSQPYKALFLYGGGGYNAARGLISREITVICICILEFFLTSIKNRFFGYKIIFWICVCLL